MSISLVAAGGRGGRSSRVPRRAATIINMPDDAPAVRCPKCDALIELVGKRQVPFEIVKEPLDSGPDRVEHTDERCRFHRFFDGQTLRGTRAFPKGAFPAESTKPRLTRPEPRHELLLFRFERWQPVSGEHTDEP